MRTTRPRKRIKQQLAADERAAGLRPTPSLPTLKFLEDNTDGETATISRDREQPEAQGD